jgi:hypothetical protein
MKRTTIMADEETLGRLQELARDQGRSFAAVVREAPDEKAATYRPRIESLGIASSEPSGTAAEKGSERTPPRSWR